MTPEAFLNHYYNEPSPMRVRKTGGRYGGPGIVVEMIQPGNDMNIISVVVAHEIKDGYGQFFHIYTPAQLELDTE